MRKTLLIALLFCSLFGVAQQKTLTEADNYIELKKYKQAKEVLIKRLKTSSDDELKDKLGEVHTLLAEWDEAIDIYEELSEKYPKVAEYRFRYGGVLALKAENSNKFIALTLIGKIRRNLVEAATLDAAHVDSRWTLVDYYLSVPGILGGSVSKARKYAKELKSISPMDGYLALGYVDQYDDEPQAAKDNYLKGLEYLEELDMINRNQLNYQIGKICGDYNIQLDKGIYHIKQYIENYSTIDGASLEWAYFRMAKLYRKKSEKEEADFWIEKALASRPDFEPALKEKSIIQAMSS